VASGDCLSSSLLGPHLFTMHGGPDIRSKRAIRNMLMAPTLGHPGYGRRSNVISNSRGHSLPVTNKRFRRPVQRNPYIADRPAWDSRTFCLTWLEDNCVPRSGELRLAGALVAPGRECRGLLRGTLIAQPDFTVTPIAAAGLSLPRPVLLIAAGSRRTRLSAHPGL
jgi:hypothetical protein